MSGTRQNEQRGTGFLNPYHFVSIPDRKSLPEELRDGRPAGHDQYDTEQGWTGSIPLTLTTQTPLLLPDHARAAAEGKGGDVPPPLPVRVDQNGRPMLSMSAVKGMLRAAYEAITNSRFGVFRHNTQLAIRSAADTKQLKPAVVIARDTEAHTARIHWVNALRPQHNVLIPRRTAANAITPHPAVWVPVKEAKKYRDGEQLEAWLCLAQHRRNFWIWRAFEIGRPGKVGTTSPNAVPTGELPASLTLSDHPFIRVVGRLHRTDSTFPAGGNKKHDERLVVERLLTPQDARLDARQETIDESLIRAWQAVIDSFTQAHDSEPDLRKKYGSYVHTPKVWRALREGRTLYIELDTTNTICALYPAMIGRKPFPGAPKVNLPELHHPATERDSLSPADRVFGWVRHGADESGVAHRGHLRIEAGDRQPEASTVQQLHPPLPLATLNSPKPSQFLFYLGDENGAPLDGKPKEPNQGYSKTAGERRLRGRKVYLTHRDVLAGAADSQTYWTPPRGPITPTTKPQQLTGNRPGYREYIAPPGFKEKVTTTIKQWVKPGATFTVLLRLDNLSRTELAALLWLLEMSERQTDAVLQLGLGKPLGFGAVRVTVDWENVRLFTGDAVRARYQSLSSVPEPEPVQAVRGLADEYDTVLAEHLTQVRAEFLAAATGFAGIPVHYPRATREPEAESYLWWVANDRSGKRLALPALSDADGVEKPPSLPYQAPPPPAPRRPAPERPVRTKRYGR